LHSARYIVYGNISKQADKDFYSDFQ